MPSDSIDTNLIIHGIIADPQSMRERIWDFFERSGSTHRVFDVAISEAIYVMDSVYEQTRTQIAENLTLFFEQFGDKLDYNRTITKMILPFWVEHPSLSYNDCYMAFMAELSSVEPFLTLDKKLANQHPVAKLLV